MNYRLRQNILDYAAFNHQDAEDFDYEVHQLLADGAVAVKDQLRSGHPEGVQRHAMLAAEVGATWDEIACSILLTEPAWGLLRAVEALPFARKGFNAASDLPAETD